MASKKTGAFDRMLQGMQYAQGLQDSWAKQDVAGLEKTALERKLAQEAAMDATEGPEVESARAAYAGLGVKAAPGLSRRAMNEQYGGLADLFKQSRDHKHALTVAKLRAAKGAGRTLVDPDTGEEVTLPGGKPSVAANSVDRNFAKDYDDFITGGGYAEVTRGLGQLKDAKAKLEKGGLTGPLRGLVPDKIRAITNPEALDTRDSVHDVAQKNLRAILGPGFTQKEGEQVMARAFNDRLDDATNAKRVGRLYEQIQKAANAKLAAAKYYEQNGTLQGFKGTVVNNVDEILAGLDSEDAPPPPGGPGGIMDTSKGPGMNTANAAPPQTPEDPDIAAYAKQYGLDYSTAAGIINGRRARAPQ